MAGSWPSPDGARWIPAHPECQPGDRTEGSMSIQRKFFRLSFEGASERATSPGVPLAMRVWFAAIHRVDETGWASFEPGELSRFVSNRIDMETGEVLPDRHVTNRLIGKMVDDGWLCEGSSLRSLGIPESLGAFGRVRTAKPGRARARDRRMADAVAGWERATERYREPGGCLAAAA